ncbi:MAG: dTMP kinase [Spirochaetaceae bacterium]|jgi:dTMP kinase|nr:dTMP kinase [Spirochaetaceae bacterium]
MNKVLKNFVVIEGCDGSGTTTQLSRLKDYFSAHDELPPLWTTSEPDSGEIGRLIRCILRGEAQCQPETLARLFAADRNEHLFGADGIVAHCARGELVVSDRYVPSSLVYQGLECGDALPRQLNQDFPAPMLLLFFDLDSETAEARMAGRSDREIFEYIEFQKKAREKYLSVLNDCRKDGSVVAIINAADSIENVFNQVLSFIAKMPILK